MRCRALWHALLAAVPLAAACTRTEWQAEFAPVQAQRTLPRDAPFLKVHTYAGQLVVLERWQIDEASQSVLGQGIHYDEARRVLRKGPMRVPFRDIALLETNRPQEVTETSLAVLGVMATLSAGMTALCVTTPKACFGSCPTFYVRRETTDDLNARPWAEGFSESVLRAFETTDVDHLLDPAGATFSGGPLRIEMRNEALETQAVRSVRLAIVPARPEAHVFRAGAEYRPVQKLEPPVRCVAETGDCLGAIAAWDGAEYSSPADGRDLAAKETVDFRFRRPAGRLGLVVTARNTLLNTFLFYQLLAYSGKQTGELIARLERDAADASKGRAELVQLGRLLGGIEIEVRSPGGWRKVGEFFEVGPIARETQLIVLPEVTGDDVELRLVMTRGNWKLERVSLGSVGERLEPRFLVPRRVLRGARESPGALAKLLDPDAYLMTYPGDVHTLELELPQGSWELFLESRGYYYEWIRGEWLVEESPLDLLRVFANPEQALRDLAPAYKKIERDMESVFWASRISGARP